MRKEFVSRKQSTHALSSAVENMDCCARKAIEIAQEWQVVEVELEQALDDIERKK